MLVDTRTKFVSHVKKKLLHYFSSCAACATVQKTTGWVTFSLWNSLEAENDSAILEWPTDFVATLHATFELSDDCQVAARVDEREY